MFNQINGSKDQKFKTPASKDRHIKLPFISEQKNKKARRIF